MKIIKELLDGATALGACRKTDGVDTLDKLVALYESPQGREFCARHNYPSREQWLGISNNWSIEELTAHNIFIDGASRRGIERNPGYIVLVGASTKAQILLEGANKKQTIIALHGANVDITAIDYAVFEVLTDDTAHISIYKDKSVIQL